MSRHSKRAKSSTVDEIAALNARVSNHKGQVLIVNQSELRPLTTRPTLGEYLRQLKERRYFIVADAKAKALRSTRDYRLWRLWLVLNPLFDVALYGLLFGFLFRTSRGVENFIGFLFLGIIFMKMMSGLVTSGSGLINGSRSMIRAFSFPRAAIPFSVTIRAIIDNSLPALVAITAAFILQWGTWPQWTIVFVLPLFVMIHIFGCGLMMIVARLSAEIPDVKALIGLFAQAWFFLSGVMFTLDRFDHVPLAQEVMSHNPAYIFLMAVRNVTIYGTMPELDTWLILIAWSLGAFVVGFIYFWKAEEKYVRLV